MQNTSILPPEDNESLDLIELQERTYVDEDTALCLIIDMDGT